MNMKSFIGIADDLAAFRRYIDEEQLDYTIFPRRKFTRPTYRYRGYLMIKIRSGEIALTTARRRMQTAIAFYRWLVCEGWFKPEYPLWDEKDILFHVVDSVGLKSSIAVKTTDVSIKSIKQNNPYDGMIEDGGKLRPLSINEQEELVKTLIEIGNIEMTLAHLIALFTGARIQTVLTIKSRHVRAELDENVMEVPLCCGPGTGIDTKYEKSQILFFPRWLYEKLQVYSYSERAEARRKKSTQSDTYLFLSSHGNPYYQDKLEINRFDKTRTKRYEASGATLRMFLSERVLPLMQKKMGKEFHYRFHDLRATFGMNLIDSQLKYVEKGDITLHDAREFVKIRMWHKSSNVTDRYLQYRKRMKMVTEVQLHYEEHLWHLIETAKNVLA